MQTKCLLVCFEDALPSCRDLFSGMGVELVAVERLFRARDDGQGLFALLPQDAIILGAVAADAATAAQLETYLALTPLHGDGGPFRILVLDQVEGRAGALSWLSANLAQAYLQQSGALAQAELNLAALRRSNQQLTERLKALSGLGWSALNANHQRPFLHLAPADPPKRLEIGERALEQTLPTDAHGLIAIELALEGADQTQPDLSITLPRSGERIACAPAPNANEGWTRFLLPRAVEFHSYSPVLHLRAPGANAALAAPQPNEIAWPRVAGAPVARAPLAMRLYQTVPGLPAIGDGGLDSDDSWAFAWSALTNVQQIPLPGSPAETLVNILDDPQLVIIHPHPGAMTLAEIAGLDLEGCAALTLSFLHHGRQAKPVQVAALAVEAGFDAHTLKPDTLEWHEIRAQGARDVTIAIGSFGRPSRLLIATRMASGTDTRNAWIGYTGIRGHLAPPPRA